jgi:hypothetical protein
VAGKAKDRPAGTRYHVRSVSGQARPKRLAGAMSVVPPVATGLRTSHIGSFVPNLELQASFELVGRIGAEGAIRPTRCPYLKASVLISTAA